MSFQPSDHLRSRTFIGLIISQILAAFNDQAIHIVAIFYASDMLVRFARINEIPGLEWFGTPVVITLGTACFITPFFLFSAWGGMLADRYSKQSSLIFWKLSEVVITGLALVGFLLPHLVPPGPDGVISTSVAIWSASLVVGAVFLMGTHSAFFVPAKYGVMPEILKPSVLSRGNGILEATSFVAQIVGTVSGGLLYFALQSDVKPTMGPSDLGREWLIGVILFILAVIGAAASFLIQRMPAASDRPLTWVDVFFPFVRLGRNIGTLLKSRPLALAVVGIAFFAFITLFARQSLLYNGETHKDLEHAEALQTNPGEAISTSADREAKEAELQVAFLIAFVGLGIGIGSPLAGYLSGNKVELGLVPIGAISLVLSTVLLALLIEPDWAAKVLGWFGVGPMAAQDLARPISAYGKYVALVLVGTSAGFFIVPLYTLLQHRAPKDSKGNLVATSNFVNVVGGLVAILAFYAVTLGLEQLKGLTLKPRDVFPAAGSADPVVVQEYLNQLEAKVDFTSLLFLCASVLTLVMLFVLCQQLPDFFIRSLLFLRKLSGRGILSRAAVHVTGVNNLPSDGPVILATNCDRPEKCMLVLGATDRVIRFLLLENERGQRLPWLLRQMAKPISLASIKHGRQTPELLEKALLKAVDVLQRGEVVGLPTDVEGSIFDGDQFLDELRKRVPAAKVVPVYCGPDEQQLAAGKKSRVWIGFDQPVEPGLSAGEIRDKIHKLGEFILDEDRKGKGVSLTGEKPKISIALAEDLPGHS